MLFGCRCARVDRDPFSGFARVSWLEAVGLAFLTLGVVGFCIVAWMGIVSLLLGVGLRDTLLGNVGDE